MKLYYSPGACSLAVHILIHELGLACDYESVNLKTKITQAGKNFFDINPKGAVPTLQLDHGEILTENQVIQQYLLDTHASDLLSRVGQMGRYRVLEWLNFVSMDLHKSVGPFFNADIPASLKESVFLPLLKAKFSIANTQLASRSFLLGDQMTPPDIYLFVVSRWLSKVGVDLSDFPDLKSFFDRMLVRTSVQAALKEEGLL